MSTETRFTGSVPRYYDQGLAPNFFEFYAEDMTQRVMMEKPKSLLELAAGTGIVTHQIADMLPLGASLIATDLNPPMLEVAQNKLKGNNAVYFQVADAEDLPFEDESFDVVFCQFGIMFFPNKLKSMQEAYRVTRPGGRYIFSVWEGWDKNPVAKLAHETISAFFTGEAPNFYKVPFSFYDTGEITETLKEAGFKKVTFEVVAHKKAIHDTPEFAKGLVYGNPMREEILNLGGDPDRAVGAIKNAVEEAFGPDNIMPLEAIIFTATK